jgi:hypothetical protein
MMATTENTACNDRRARWRKNVLMKGIAAPGSRAIRPASRYFSI